MNIRYIVICIIASITLSLVTACNRSKIEPLGGDDQPILVVGGSLHVSASNGKWGKNADGKWEHKAQTGSASTKYITKIEVFHVENNATVVDKIHVKDPVKIDMSFGLGPSPVVLENVNSQHTLTLSPGGQPDSDSTGLSFDTGGAHLTKVNITGVAKDFLCGSNGQCTLVIHYCDVSDGCK